MAETTPPPEISDFDFVDDAMALTTGELAESIARDEREYNAALEFLTTEETPATAEAHQKTRRAVDPPALAPLEKAKGESKEDGRRRFDNAWHAMTQSAIGSKEEFTKDILGEPVRRVRDHEGRVVAIIKQGDDIRRNPPAGPKQRPPTQFEYFEDQISHANRVREKQKEQGVADEDLPLVPFTIGAPEIKLPAVLENMRNILLEHPELYDELAARMEKAGVKFEERHEFPPVDGPEDAKGKEPTALQKAHKGLVAARDEEVRSRAEEARLAAAKPETLTDEDNHHLKHGLRHHRAGRHNVYAAWQKDLEMAARPKHKQGDSTRAFMTKERKAWIYQHREMTTHNRVQANLDFHEASRAFVAQVGREEKNVETLDRLGLYWQALEGSRERVDYAALAVPDDIVENILEVTERAYWDNESDITPAQQYALQYRLGTHIAFLRKEMAPYEDENDKTRSPNHRRYEALWETCTQAVELYNVVDFLKDQSRAQRVKWTEGHAAPDYEGRIPVVFTEDGGIQKMIEGSDIRGILYADGSVDLQDGRGRRNALGEPVIPEAAPEEAAQLGMVLRALSHVAGSERANREQEVAALDSETYEELQIEADLSLDRWWYDQTNPELRADAYQDALRYDEYLQQIVHNTAARREELLNHPLPPEASSEEHNARVVEIERLAAELRRVNETISLNKYRELYLDVRPGGGSKLQPDGSVVADTTLHGRSGPRQVWPDGYSRDRDGSYYANGRAV
jgi:hypothetical protein